MHIKIIRHSERLDYTYPLYWLFCLGHYWSDPPLTTNGHIVALEKGRELASSKFNPKYIYTSPYTRTLATSTEIRSSFPQTEIMIEPLLSEYQPHYAHRINLYPNGIPTLFEGQETGFSYPESFEDFSKRIQFIIDKLIEKNNDDIIIITHGEVVKLYANYIQTLYPDLLLDLDSIPYLTTLSFIYDKTNNRIDEKSVKLD